ncbi:MAG: pyruvate dehydrogenase (acetyl-transferring), homodimeric type [Magnetococcales bacterium]|nr:pyruvate dehydrogenase (acetyl-transferring), homodimeric type [Magnetococcales bacterium]
MTEQTTRQQEQERETQEWRESLEYVLEHAGAERVSDLLRELQRHAHKLGIRIPFSANTPYMNTIPPAEQPAYPGNREIERRIKSLIRWNAMAMVVRANQEHVGIGGHISTFASAATLYEVAFNHFFRGPEAPCGGDLVFFQGHASPGIYARAFLEGRLSERDLAHFRKELADGGGLSSYPHPWLMPNFWQVPTVSMGLGPIMAIYQARFMRYLEDRGLRQPGDAKIWAFLGDGETDEPESLGAISLAAREHLDNLIFVINCNLQRLDGPVRGNGQIIQELEADFRGAGWNVIKVIWGQDWDPLFEKDREGLLARRLAELVDGEYQKLSIEGGNYVRQQVFGRDPRLLELVTHHSDEQLHRMRRGGHDPEKVYAAFDAAMHHRGAPTVVLAMTVKGYGLGAAGEGLNITHQQKKMTGEELRAFRSRFGIPLSDDEVGRMPFYRPTDGSEEMRYLQEQRRKLGGYLPSRKARTEPIQMPAEEIFHEFDAGSGERDLSTTMVFVRLLTRLLKDPSVGKLVVPIVPDEARTFGMEALFRQCGIYSHPGQLYEPVDSKSLLYYKEAHDGQILEEGITEAGGLSSFIAAGTAYANHGVNTIPFFIYYSMFGLQRVGDLVWAAADMRAHGFLLGGTAGRTTLAGEGLQHQDGQSHLLALPVPTLMAYDPAYAYEVALIVREGLRRMYVDQEDLFYYITVMNENYLHPPMPEGVEEGVLKGMYLLQGSDAPAAWPRVQLFGSGAILNEVVKAKEMLAQYEVAAEVWSVTSYKELRRDALEIERWNMLNPGLEPLQPYLVQCLKGRTGPFVAATDYVKALPDLIAKWLPGPLTTLGTDGFGRSETRSALRDFFEVDRRYVALAALSQLHRLELLPVAVVQRAIQELEIDPDRPNPVRR